MSWRRKRGTARTQLLRLMANPEHLGSWRPTELGRLLDPPMDCHNLYAQLRRLLDGGLAQRAFDGTRVGYCLTAAGIAEAAGLVENQAVTIEQTEEE